MPHTYLPSSLLWRSKWRDKQLMWRNCWNNKNFTTTYTFNLKPRASLAKTINILRTLCFTKCVMVNIKLVCTCTCTHRYDVGQDVNSLRHCSAGRCTSALQCEDFHVLAACVSTRSVSYTFHTATLSVLESRIICILSDDKKKWYSSNCTSTCRLSVHWLRKQRLTKYVASHTNLCVWGDACSTRLSVWKI